MEQIRVVLTTVPNEETAASIAGRLVDERFAACVNVLPGVRSFYVWEGERQDDSEVLLVAKVRADRLFEYEARMTELHPYSVPEIVALSVDRVNIDYLAWCLRLGSPEG